MIFWFRPFCVQIITIIVIIYQIQLNVCQNICIINFFMLQNVCFSFPNATIDNTFDFGDLWKQIFQVVNLYFSFLDVHDLTVTFYIYIFRVPSIHSDPNQGYFWIICGKLSFSIFMTCLR